MRVFHKSLNVAVTGPRDREKNGELPVGETGRALLRVCIISGRRDILVPIRLR